MKTFTFFIAMSIVCLCFGISQQQTTTRDGNEPIIFKVKSYEPNFKGFKNEYLKKVYSTGKSFYKQKDQWQNIIDSVWGPGPSTTDKLKIFDAFWTKVDQQYGCFPNLSINWDSLRNVFRPQVEAGVSRGRFYSIMSQMCQALQELHTYVYDNGVDSIFNDPSDRFSFPHVKPGIPLVIVGGWVISGFGAGLSPLQDSSLLVYRVQEGHPLGLQPGDIVTGYDGKKWVQLIKDIKDAQLPVSMKYGAKGTDPQSEIYEWLISAGCNWHLFDTIDVVKYSTGDTVHLSTTPLATAPYNWDTLACLGQIPITGIPQPRIYENIWTTYGIIPGTQIGYVQVAGMNYGGGQQFSTAIESLMYKATTSGLILDFRLHYGGRMDYAKDGFAALFNVDPTPNLLIGHRTDPLDHMGLTLGPVDEFWFHPIPVTPDVYDRPIAVLTGPGCWSAGDYAAFLLRFHPMVRMFGKRTNTAYVDGQYDEGTNLAYTGSGWQYKISKGSAYSNYNGEGYLIHKGFNVDEEILLNREDAAHNIDAVVKRAKEWINNSSYAHKVRKDKIWYQPINDTIKLNAQVENPNVHPLTVTAYYRNGETILDSSLFYDDGLHNDSMGGDGLWGTRWALPNKQAYYNVNVSTYDPVDDKRFTLQYLVPFSNVGPVVIDSMYCIRTSSESIQADIWLRNQSPDTTIFDIVGNLTTTDPNIKSFGFNNMTYRSLNPGQRKMNTYTFNIDTSLHCADLQLTLDVEADEIIYWSYYFEVPVRSAPIISQNILDYGVLHNDEIKTDSIMFINRNPLSLNVFLVGSDNSTQYTVSPLSTIITASDSAKFYITFHPTPGGPRTRSGQISFWYEGDGSPKQLNLTGMYSPTSIQITVDENWNMVSVPMKVASYMKDSIFFSSNSGAFTYQGSYITKEILSNGVGYWVKYPVDQTIEVVGEAIPVDTFDVDIGWNMIGSISYPVLVNNIVGKPSGIVVNGFYHYKKESGYDSVDTIEPGNGYWVKVNQSGQLILSSGSQVLAVNLIKIVASDEQPPPPPDGEIQNLKSVIPNQFALEQNYPNPFNPLTAIIYQLPVDGWVTLKVYNVLGQEVMTLVNEVNKAGSYEVKLDGSKLSSGLYLYRLTAGNYVETRKLLMMK